MFSGQIISSLTLPAAESFVLCFLRTGNSGFQIPHVAVSFQNNICRTAVPTLLIPTCIRLSSPLSLFGESKVFCEIKNARFCLAFLFTSSSRFYSQMFITPELGNFIHHAACL